QIGCRRFCQVCRAIFGIQRRAQPQQLRYWDFVRVTHCRTALLNLCRIPCYHEPVAGREARGKITLLFEGIVAEVAAEWAPNGEARVGAGNARTSGFISFRISVKESLKS